jgi:hypothetical protein
MYWENEASLIEREVLERLHGGRSGTWYCRAFFSPASGEWLLRVRREDGLKLAVTVGPETSDPAEIARAVEAMARRLRPAWLSASSCPA